MAKVIVERPRYGSRASSRKKGYRKYLKKVGLENLPRRESLAGRWRGMDKEFNEHLGPMKRFLRSRVGRPWNKVHQELCEHISFDNVVQKHVLTHIYQFVHRLVEVDDAGRVWDRERLFSFLSLLSKSARQLSAGEMYVCPKTGLLRVVRARRSHSQRQRYDLGKFKQMHCRDGEWWELTLRPLAPEPGDIWDVWLNAPAAKFGDRQLREVYGGRFVAISARALTRREVQAVRRAAHERRRGRAQR